MNERRKKLFSHDIIDQAQAEAIIHFKCKFIDRSTKVKNIINSLYNEEKIIFKIRLVGFFQSQYINLLMNSGAVIGRSNDCYNPIVS